MIRVILFIALLLVQPVIADDQQDEKRKLQKVGAQIQTLQKGIKSASKQIQTLELELETAERSLVKTKKSISQLKTNITKAQTKLSQLQTKKQHLEQQKAAQQKAIAEQINLNYRLGREPTIKLLLNQESSSEVSRLLRYHDYFLRARANKLNQYLKVLKNIAAVELNISNTLTELEKDQLSLTNQLKQQTLAQKSRTATLAKMAKSVATDNQALQQLLIEKKRLQAVIEKLSQAIAHIALPDSINPFSSQKGKLLWPTKGVLKNRFGQSRNTKMKWDGWLIAAAEGVKINSIHHGRVIFADYLRGHGLLIVIDHGEGYMSLYAHNQMLLAETGEWVLSGATIAKAGQTGGQNQTGLYFEIRHNGKPTNPSSWLKSKG